MFVDNTATISNPDSITYKISTIDRSGRATVIALAPQGDDTLQNLNAQFIQTQELTALGYAVQPYGALFVPMPLATGGDSVYLEAALGASSIVLLRISCI